MSGLGAAVPAPRPHPAGLSESTLLAVGSLTTGYGRVTVVRGMSFAVAPGSVLAVLGPNGAGKTTLLLTLAGLLPRTSGTVAVGGHALPSGQAAAANRAGVVLVPDDRALFSTLTVRENLMVARTKRGPTLDELLDLFPALRQRLRVAAASLSGGEQQMLAVARGLSQRPRLLLIDEMSMGLAPVIVEDLLPVVRQVADSTGAAVVLVEQHVHLALEVADHALVVVHGEVALSGTAADLAADRAGLEAAYLSGNAEAPKAG